MGHVVHREAPAGQGLAAGGQAGDVLAGHAAQDGVCQARRARGHRANELDALARGNGVRGVQVEHLKDGEAQRVPHAGLQLGAPAQAGVYDAVKLALGDHASQHQAARQGAVALIEGAHGGVGAQEVAGTGVPAAALGRHAEGHPARGRQPGLASH